MSRLFVGAGVAVTALAAVSVVIQQQSNRAMRQEIAGLREEVRAAVAVREPRDGTVAAETNVRAVDADALPSSANSSQAEELAKLREEIAGLRRSTQEFTQVAQTAAAMKSLAGTETSVATKLTPAEALKNAGKATPEAATETALWAAVGGDVDTLSNTMVFTPSAREKADAWFASLSDATRQQYGSPEKVIALMIAKDAASLAGMQVVGQKEIAPDNVGVRVRFATSDGKTKDDSLLMRRVADGWRMVLNDAVVEKFARQLNPKR